MEVRTLFITPHALQTVQVEFEYLRENVSSGFAKKFLDGFQKKVDSILPHFLTYPECRFLTTPKQIYRNIIWGNYLIVYKILKDEILVLGVFYAKRNPKRINQYRRIKKD